MIQAIFVPFFTIIFAELLDKSQLSLILISSKTKRVLPLFLGAMLAFIIVDGIAIVLGSFISSLIDPKIFKFISSFIFIGLGIFTLIHKDKDAEVKKTNHSLFVQSFLVIFFSEWADKTQLISAAFVGIYQPIFVFIGVILAMAILSVLAIFLGKVLLRYISEILLKKVSAVLFIAIGLLMLGGLI